MNEARSKKEKQLLDRSRPKVLFISVVSHYFLFSPWNQKTFPKESVASINLHHHYHHVLRKNFHVPHVPKKIFIITIITFFITIITNITFCSSSLSSLFAITFSWAPGAVLSRHFPINNNHR